jgi:hypothetical protein
MGKDDEALLRLWREKLGEEAPAAPSDVVQLSFGHQGPQPPLV